MERETFVVQSYNYYKIENQCIPTALHGEQSFLSEWGEIYKNFPRPISTPACSFLRIPSGSWTRWIQTPQDLGNTCTSGHTLGIIYSPTHAEVPALHHPSVMQCATNVMLVDSCVVLLKEKCSPVLLESCDFQTWNVSFEHEVLWAGCSKTVNRSY